MAQLIEGTRDTQAAADRTTLADLATQAQQMLDGLQAIVTHMDQITAGPGAPTAGQTGTALKLLAGDVKTLAQGQARLVRVLGIVVRRAQG